MTFVMGIVTMVRLTRNMPRKLTEATLYSTNDYYTDSPAKGIPVAGTEYVSMMKRMADLEEKMNTLSKKPTTMPPEKEEQLNAALSRVETLEQELSVTKKVYQFRLTLPITYPYLKG